MVHDQPSQFERRQRHPPHWEEPGATYFGVFAAVDPRGPAAVEEVYHTLARDDPIVVTFGQPEVRGRED